MTSLQSIITLIKLIILLQNIFNFGPSSRWMTPGQIQPGPSMYHRLACKLGQAAQCGWLVGRGKKGVRRQLCR